MTISLALEVNAILSPRGDQLGLPAFTGALVIWAGFSSREEVSQISPVCLKAIFLPSGDHEA
jgi:hypothetical protein